MPPLTVGLVGEDGSAKCNVPLQHSSETFLQVRRGSVADPITSDYSLVPRPTELVTSYPCSYIVHVCSVVPSN